MKRILKITALFYCIFNFLSSCNSKPNINNNNNAVDSTYINDSLAIARQILACDTPYKSVDLIVLLDNTNEDEYAISFCSQMNERGQVLSKGKPIKVPSSYFWIYDRPTFKVSQEALYYFADYIDKNCECKNPIGKAENQFNGMYVFKLIQGEKMKTCYLYLRDIDIVLDYFKGLNLRLANPKYKNEFKEFLEFVKRQIRKLENEKERR